MAIDPRIKILYLILVAVGCFLIKDPMLLSGLFALQVGLWVYNRLPFSDMVRVFRKLSFFIILILLTFAFFATEALESDVWQDVPIGGFHLKVNITGLTLGLLMSLRMLTVIFGSLVVQMTSKPGEFVEGLRGIKLPQMAALTIDSTLHLLGPRGDRKTRHQGMDRQAGGGRGSGGGGGGGRRQEGDGLPVGQAGGAESLQGAERFQEGGFVFAIKRIIKGDVGFLVVLIENALARSKAHIEGQQSAGGGGMDAKMLNDVAVISGLCLLMLTAKLLKILPGIPFAPGFKIMFLVPLYILAAELTHTKFASTITGTTVGVISFLFGDGRFGIFEIAKHITPGIVVDLTAPLMRRWMAKPSVIVFMILGAVCALARITTILLVTLFIEAPPIFYAILIPTSASQVFFGTLSGFVTYYLVKSLGRLKIAAGIQSGPASSPEVRQETELAEIKER